MKDARNEYADIIDHPHHVSEKRQPMSRLNRAAQFSPFAALTGYDDLVEESARYTSQKRELDNEEKDAIDKTLSYILAQSNSPKATFTFFSPDEKKSGGAYFTVTDRLLKYNPIEKELLLESGIRVWIEDLYSVIIDE